MSRFGLSRGVRVDKGQYLLTQCLGSGGMGEVWEAFDQQLHRHVALKFLQEKPDESKSEPRVVTEARHTLLHEHIVHVNGLGKLNEIVPFLVMERLVGRTLHDEVRAQGRLSVAQVANVLLPIVCAIGTAHAARIVHRDIKPRNIFLVDRADGASTSKLLDFGISRRLVGGEDIYAEHSGTPGYRAPEQLIKEGKLGLAIDIWALGLVLYECLVGERFWRPEAEEESTVISNEAMAAKMQDSLLRLPADLPVQLIEIIRQTLQLDPSLRPTLEWIYDSLVPFATISVPSFLVPSAAAAANLPHEFMGASDEATKTRTAASTGSNRSSGSEFAAEDSAIVNVTSANLSSVSPSEVSQGENPVHITIIPPHGQSSSSHRPERKKTVRLVYAASIVGFLALLLGINRYVEKSIDVFMAGDPAPAAAPNTATTTYDSPWIYNRFLTAPMFGTPRVSRQEDLEITAASRADARTTRKIAASQEASDEVRPQRIKDASSGRRIEEPIASEKPEINFGEAAGPNVGEEQKSGGASTMSVGPAATNHLKFTPKALSERFPVKSNQPNGSEPLR